MIPCLGILVSRRNKASRSSYAGKGYIPSSFQKIKKKVKCYVDPTSTEIQHAFSNKTSKSELTETWPSSY
jgi:hypothetical protein